VAAGGISQQLIFTTARRKWGKCKTLFLLAGCLESDDGMRGMLAKQKQGVANNVAHAITRFNISGYSSAIQK